MRTDAEAGRRLWSSCAETLTSWHCADPDQDSLRTLFLEHLANHGDGWSRGCTGSHLTASTLICTPVARQVLLTLHAKIGRWLQTGGHLEVGDASLQCAAQREALEESGLGALTLDPAPLLLSRHQVSCGGRPTFHLDVQFLVVAGRPGPPVVGPESLDLRWFDAADLPDVDGSVRQLVAAAAGRLGWT